MTTVHARRKTYLGGLDNFAGPTKCGAIRRPGKATVTTDASQVTCGECRKRLAEEAIAHLSPALTQTVTCVYCGWAGTYEASKVPACCPRCGKA